MFYLSDYYISFYVYDIKISISFAFLSTLLIVILLWRQSKLIELSEKTLGRVEPSFRTSILFQIIGSAVLSYWIVVNLMKYIY